MMRGSTVEVRIMRGRSGESRMLVWGRGGSTVEVRIMKGSSEEVRNVVH